MADAANINLGVCSVSRNGVDLGHTIGGVIIRYAPEFHETKVDKFGNSVVEKFLIGERISAEFSLAEWTLSNLLVAIEQGTQVADDSVSIGSNAGKRSSAKAAHWVFHPIENAASVRDEDVGIYKGVVSNELEIAYNNEGERVLPVVVDGLIDENRSDGNMLAFIGDSIS